MTASAIEAPAAPCARWLRVARLDSPGLRGLLRAVLAESEPGLLVVDLRAAAPVPVAALVRLVRLRRVVRARGGELCLLLDHAGRDRLTRSGLEGLLTHAGTAAEAIALIPLPRAATG